MASEKILKFVEEIKTLTVLELNELVKAIEEEFGVSAAAPVVMAGGSRRCGPCRGREERVRRYSCRSWRWQDGRHQAG